MFVPYETTPLPTTPDITGAQSLLPQVLNGELPGFALHNAGLSRVPELNMRYFFGSICAEAGFALQRTADVNAHAGGDKAIARAQDVPGRYSILYDFALHLDAAYLDPADPPVTGINMHYTSLGNADATFLRLQPGQQELPPSDTCRFPEGLVDDTIIDPHGFAVRATAGTLLVFAAEGSAGLAHHFRTRTAPRHATILSAQRVQFPS